MVLSSTSTKDLLKKPVTKGNKYNVIIRFANVSIIILEFYDHGPIWRIPLFHSPHSGLYLYSWYNLSTFFKEIL